MTRRSSVASNELAIALPDHGASVDSSTGRSKEAQQHRRGSLLPKVEHDEGDEAWEKAGGRRGSVALTMATRE
jgi:hypothetical protein